MITRLTVPPLDANILDVTITAWRKTPGEMVRQGEIVAELTTDKATFDLEAMGSGTLLAILAAPKSVVPSGYILALLGEPGETDERAVAQNQALMSKYRAAAGHPSTTPRGPTPATATPPPATPPAPATRIRATPRARRLAQEHGLDLAHIQAETGAEVVDEAVLQPYLRKAL